MKFVYPEFLWTLLTLTVPVVIHLFNFRKYKTLYFSSLSFIKRVDQETKSTQKLKHLLVLLLRLLALTCIILAFAQPFLPVQNKSQSGGKPLLSIYIDNSFSMTAKGSEGELLSEARELARNTIKNAPIETRFLLCTNFLNGVERRLMTKAEALDYLDQIEPTPLNRKLSDVLNWQKGFINEENTTRTSLGAKQYVVFSDFQKTSAELKNHLAENDAYIYPVQLKAQQSENLYIDSMWFSSPIFKLGQNNELNVRIVNSGSEDITNTEISAEIGEYKRDVFVDVKANSYTITQINYTDKTGGYKKGRLSINDKQLFWDDDFYFSYFVENNTEVLVLNGEDNVEEIMQVFSLEPYYKVQSVNQNSFTFDQLNTIDLIVLNGVNLIPSGLAENLESFAQNGGSISFFPGKNPDFSSYNSLLTKLKMPLLSNTISSGTKIDRLIYDDPFFYGMFEKKKEKLNLPSVTKAFQLSQGNNASFYELIKMQNEQALFIRSSGFLNCYLYSSFLDASFGTFLSDALFPSLLLRIGEMSQRRRPNWLTIGSDNSFPLYKTENKEAPIHMKNEAIDFVPQCRKESAASYLSISGQAALEVLKAGIFDILTPELDGYIAVNYDRQESKINALEGNEINQLFEDAGYENVRLFEMDRGQGKIKIDIEKPYEFWKIFLILGLLFLLIEMLVLKFWK